MGLNDMLIEPFVKVLFIIVIPKAMVNFIHVVHLEKLCLEDVRFILTFLNVVDLVLICDLLIISIFGLNSINYICQDVD